MDVYFSNHTFTCSMFIFARYDRRMVVYGYKPDTFIAVYPALQEQTPHVATSSKTLRSIWLIGSPKTTVIV